jgi:hypothetical protein
MPGLVLIWITVGVCIGVALSYAWSRFRQRSRDAAVDVTPVAQAQVTRGSVSIVRPSTQTVEGLELRYGAEGLVRSVRVGAMNSEHKELLLTMDAIVWRALPNAQKQEVLAVARSTWAAKMCPDGPDIAYVVLKTENGEIVGRADPHRVTIV